VNNLFGREIPTPKTRRNIAADTPTPTPKTFDPLALLEAGVCEHFGTNEPDRTIYNMGPTWRRFAMARIDRLVGEGDEEAFALFDSAWKLQYLAECEYGV